MIKWKALKVRRTSLRQPWHLRPFTTATWHNLTGSELIMNASSTTKLHWCSERCKRTHWDVLREIEMTLVRFHDFSEATVPGPPTTEWLEQNRPYFQLQSYPTLSNIIQHYPTLSNIIQHFQTFPSKMPMNEVFNLRMLLGQSKFSQKMSLGSGALCNFKAWPSKRWSGPWLKGPNARSRLKRYSWPGEIAKKHHFLGDKNMSLKVQETFVEPRHSQSLWTWYMWM